MKYNLNWLIEKYHQSERLKFLFFWGHQPKKDGSIGEACMSQWWIAPFQVDGIVYPTAEHWMMAEKARLFNDQKALQKIIQAKSPAEAKKLGRTVQNFDSSMWEAKRYEIVKRGNVHKFSQHPELKSYLLGTGERILVEASPVDAIWGIGLAKDRPETHHPPQWKGLNLLGFALMEVREELAS